MKTVAMKTTARVIFACALLGTPTVAQGILPEGAAPVRLRGVPFDEVQKHIQERVLVGREQGGNSFRDKTPALARGDTRIRKVDPVELRRRKLAMYEEHAMFTDFLEPIEEPADSTPSGAANPGSKPLEQHTPLWKWLALSVFLGISLLLARVTVSSRN